MEDPKKIARIKHDRFVHDVSMRAKEKREAILSDLARRGMASGGAFVHPTLKLGYELTKELVDGLVKIHMETVGPDEMDYEETANWIHQELKWLWDSLARNYLERDRSLEQPWRQVLGQSMPHQSHIEQDLRVAAFDLRRREGAGMVLDKRAAADAEARSIVADTIMRARGKAQGILNTALSRGFAGGTALMAPVADILGRESAEMLKSLARVYGACGGSEYAEKIGTELAKLKEDLWKLCISIPGVGTDAWEEATERCLPGRQRIVDELTVAAMAVRVDQRVQVGQQFNFQGGNSGVLVAGNAQVGRDMTGTVQAKEGEGVWGLVKKAWSWVAGWWKKGA